MIEELILLSFCIACISLIWIWVNRKGENSFTSSLPNHREFFFIKDINNLGKSPTLTTSDQNVDFNIRSLPTVRAKTDQNIRNRKHYLPSTLLPFASKNVRASEIKPSYYEEQIQEKQTTPSSNYQSQRSNLLISIQKEGEENYEKQKNEEKEKKKQEREKKEKEREEREEKAKAKIQQSKAQSSSSSSSSPFKFDFGSSSIFNFSNSSTTSNATTSSSSSSTTGENKSATDIKSATDTKSSTDTKSTELKFDFGIGSKPSSTTTAFNFKF
ncbi:hypothetical protein GPJ56_008170 [Histomonas meleagridis]|uniref:uncharacterized protein n=1 Tax=Histomonas meleagridis TaxID=135588 RepID=UPI00355A58F3|nr:hypothetical protein GPJ56_008170 [Histomonas meleagridis]KAH0797191.1 hypothetical protein GO595_009873 [Histomonas meleagridis]